MISNSGSDERGKYSGGVAGDSTGKEWRIIPWYNRPWNCVIRHPNKEVREKIAELAEQAANNNHIGYDQNERWTFWNQLKKVGYYPVNITTNCEADCSAGVISITWAVGHLLGYQSLKDINATYTGNMREAYRKEGFLILTEDKYLSSSKYILRGDILLNDAHHVATNLTTGIYAEEVDELTRAEIIELIDNRLEVALKGYNTKPSKWAEPIIKEAKEKGITDGSRPKGYMTREEGAAMALKAVKLSEDDGK